MTCTGDASTRYGRQVLGISEIEILTGDKFPVAVEIWLIEIQLETKNYTNN